MDHGVYTNKHDQLVQNRVSKTLKTQERWTTN